MNKHDLHAKSAGKHRQGEVTYRGSQSYDTAKYKSMHYSPYDAPDVPSPTRYSLASNTCMRGSRCCICPAGLPSSPMSPAVCPEPTLPCRMHPWSYSGQHVQYLHRHMCCYCPNPYRRSQPAYPVRDEAVPDGLGCQPGPGTWPGGSRSHLTFSFLPHFCQHEIKC